MVGEHGADAGAAALAAVLRVRPGGVWEAYALGTSASEELKLTTGQYKTIISTLI